MPQVLQFVAKRPCGEYSYPCNCGEKSYGEMTVASFVWRNGREPVKESVSHHIRLVYLIRELAYLIYVFLKVQVAQMR